MKPYYDVVTIGAGPAGAVSAYGAARLGRSVLLVEKAAFPRFKVCGCCLNARSVDTLSRLEMGDALRGLDPRPLTRLELRAPGRHATLPLRGSVSVSRSRFDAMLVQQARAAGAEFVDRASATMGPLQGAGRRVDLRRQEGARQTIEAGVVIVADGLAGTALRGQPGLDATVARDSRIGAGTVVAGRHQTPDGVLTLTCTAMGYVGVVQLEDDRLDIAAALDRTFVSAVGGPGVAAARVLHDAGHAPLKGLASAPWRGTPALTRTRAAVAGERYLVVGDAAGYVEPFTGEGIAWAITGAVALVRSLPKDGLSWHADCAADWIGQHRKLVANRQWGCRALAGLLRHPAATRFAIGFLGHAPRLAAPWVRRLTQPLSGS